MAEHGGLTIDELLLVLEFQTFYDKRPFFPLLSMEPRLKRGINFDEDITVLQTLASNESYPNEPILGEDHGQSFNVRYYTDILKRRFFYFLLPFGMISILGLYLITIFLKPSYFSEGKILVEIAPDFVGPITSATTASERVQRIQQRVMTRDNLLSIASRFGLFPNRSGVLELMRESSQFKPIEVVGQSRPTIAFTVGFEY